MPNTATIIITETTDQIQVRIEYDPMPTKDGPINNAAVVAHQMVTLFHEQQPEEALASQTKYNSDTGETFTTEKEKPKEHS